ncbi:MAG TPA: hypothetical protein VE077_00915 [Candidatus Methylomirabilis sp.]|nr:hypothetical protein [Candidatus Methylomirabilis sp.]
MTKRKHSEVEMIGALKKMEAGAASSAPAKMKCGLTGQSRRIGLRGAKAKRPATAGSPKRAAPAEKQKQIPAA